MEPPVGDLTFFNQRRSVGSPCWSRNVFGSSTELSAGGAKRNIENTPKPYTGLTIQSRPCWPYAGFGLVEQIFENDKVDKGRCKKKTLFWDFIPNYE